MGPHILAKFQFCSFTLSRSKTAVIEPALACSHEQIHNLDFFRRFFDAIELGSRKKINILISLYCSFIKC